MCENNIFLELSHYDINGVISERYEKGIDTGLGNLLFQVASCISYSLKHDAKLYVPSLNTYFKSENLQKENTIFRNINTDIIPEYSNIQNIYYDTSCKPNTFIHDYKFFNNSHFKGYFENVNNYNNIRELILKLFETTIYDIEYIYNKYKKIYENTTCSIHIRGKHTVLGHFKAGEIEKYIISYKQMIQYMIREKQIKTIYVLTNDREFSDIVMNEFKNSLDVIYTDEEPFIDIWIISLIKNNIVSMSTLGWWGSYLNNNIDRCIVYHKYFVDDFIYVINRQDNFYLKEWKIVDID
jgi:hypothetical protein